jgi:hypothetical protein
VGGLTLRDVLDMRIKNSKPYHEEEILDFISAVSFTLGYFETEFGIYHG